MARTMKWPPIPENGRIPMVEGANATSVVILMTLSDLQTNPFNPDRLSLGNVTFKVQSSARAMVENALQRLKRSISIEAITEKVDNNGNAEYTVIFSDRETRTRAEVTVNG